MNKIDATIETLGQRRLGADPCTHTVTMVRLHGHPSYEGIEVARIKEKYYLLCGFCGGTGYRPGMVLDGGRCWPCHYNGHGELIGQGTVEEMTATLRRRAADKARRDAKKERDLAARREAHAAWWASQHELKAIADALASQPDARWDTLLTDLLARAGHVILTEPQVRLALTLYAQCVERQATVSERSWLGEVGDKITVSGEITYGRIFEGDFGLRTLYTVTTAEGNVAVWWRTGAWDAVRGTKVTLTGRIKKLTDDPQYGKQTVLTRCKIESE